MSAVTKKPTAGATPGRRSTPESNSTSARASPAPAVSATSNGIARNRSIRTTARASMQRPGAGASNLSSNSITSDADEDARAETVALLDDLKEQLRTSENNADQYSKQAQVLQSRLDEALHEQGKLEDKLHENEERIEALENDKRDALRQRREMESIYEAERSSMNKEREEMSNREEEMQSVIQRLKDSLNTRANLDEDGRIPRRSNNNSPSLESQFAPTSGLNRSDSRNNSKLILQKDRLIESLRLELAEAQIKMVESENMGGGRFQEVERKLLEARMANARLMEDNESYQLLLSEKTLTGDFKSEFLSSASNEDALSALEGRTAVPSLADELSEAGDGESENNRRLDSELKAAKAENKALTLYINKIIERLLQHQDFEAILDQSSDFKPVANTDKDLPPPPPPKEASGTSILQRAKSVAMGGGRRSRPQSVMPAPYSAITDPDTAPSIPIGLTRSNTMRNRPASEQFTGGPANIVSQMYKGPGQMSPPIHSPSTPRNSQSFFATQLPGGQNPNAASRVPSGNQVPSSGNFPGMRSESSSESGDVNTPGNTPPRPVEKATTFAGNKPRPLRLVQDKVTAEETANKRSSWMGWAFGSKKEETTGGNEESIREER